MAKREHKLKEYRGEKPPILWWYRDGGVDAQHVLLVYLERRAFKFDREAKRRTRDDRWASVCRALEIQALAGTVPKEFPASLERWLADLTMPAPAKKHEYWTLEGYAAAHKIKPIDPFYAWLRALEKVAKELYPLRVPPGRHDSAPLTDEQKQAIRAEYLETGNAREIAARYQIEPFLVGQLCRKEKAQRSAQSESQETVTPPILEPDDLDPY